MIVDCFIFFNEIDMVEGRIKYLYSKVDLFVIVESNYTHSGKSKPYNFEAFKSRFEPYMDKIHYVKMAPDISNYDFSKKVDKYDPNSAPWLMEKDQRDYIKTALLDLNLSDDTYILISDADEIPSKLGIDLAIQSVHEHKVITLLQQMYVYNFRNKHRPHPVTQYGLNGYPQTVLTTIGYLKQTTPEELRQNRAFHLCILNVGGWHLSYWMNSNEAKLKLESFSHQETNNGIYNDITHIEKSIAQGKWLFDSEGENLLEPANPLEIDSEIWDIFLPLSGDINHYYQNVGGWFSPEDASLYKLMVQAANNGAKFVEVGSYQGRSSVYMGVEIYNSKKKIDFTCIDLWDDVTYNGSSRAIFDNNMRPLKGHYTALQMNSVEAANRFEDSSLDFVFIDADHSYESVKADIEAWLPKVKKGGFIGGHDQYFPEVNRAVSEKFGDFAVIGTCWLVAVSP